MPKSKLGLMRVQDTPKLTNLVTNNCEREKKMSNGLWNKLGLETKFVNFEMSLT